jgi:hypothetical protein
MQQDGVGEYLRVKMGRDDGGEKEIEDQPAV